MKEKARIGYIGLGSRGMGVLKLCYAEMGDVEIVGLCDWNSDAMLEAAAFLEEKGKPRPYMTTDFHCLLEDETIDAIVIMSGWNTHVELAKASLLAGKYTAIEVGCAYDIQECHELIEAYEKTKAPLMMLENCCYGRTEMMVLNMVKQGLFGEIVHCKGGYHHYLPGCDLLVPARPGSNFEDPNWQESHYRIREYISRNCEQYPTHELGPICKVLGINRGNRMMKLTSVASKSLGLKTYAQKHLPETSYYNHVEYKQGDIVNTCITCANGETILLTLDTTLPRPYYSRDFTVRGTMGSYSEERHTVYFEGMEEGVENNEAEYYEKYDHPLHKDFTGVGKETGHGGLDWLICRAFIESVKSGTNTPIDAYDTVSWMAIGALSEMSIQKGGAPVDIPDFTKGKWMRREPPVTGPYSLDQIYVGEV